MPYRSNTEQQEAKSTAPFFKAETKVLKRSMQLQLRSTEVFQTFSSCCISVGYISAETALGRTRQCEQGKRQEHPVPALTLPLLSRAELCWPSSEGTNCSFVPPSEHSQAGQVLPAPVNNVFRTGSVVPCRSHPLSLSDATAEPQLEAD